MDVMLSPPKRCLSFPLPRLRLYPFSKSGVILWYYVPDVPVHQVVFQTKVYHPGINEEGSICVPILRDEVSRIFLDLYNAIVSWREVDDDLFLFHLSCDPTVCHQWKPSITLSTGKPS